MNEADKQLLLKFITTYPSKNWDSLIMTMAVNGITNLNENSPVPKSLLKTLELAKTRQLTDPLLQHAEFGFQE